MDPYPHGPERLLSDIILAVAQFNGTLQDGQLGGLSPKGMLEAKISASGWTAQVPDEATFDLVFTFVAGREAQGKSDPEMHDAIVNIADHLGECSIWQSRIRETIGRAAFVNVFVKPSGGRTQ